MNWKMELREKIRSVTFLLKISTHRCRSRSLIESKNIFITVAQDIALYRGSSRPFCLPKTLWRANVLDVASSSIISISLSTSGTSSDLTEEKKTVIFFSLTEFGIGLVWDSFPLKLPLGLLATVSFGVATAGTWPSALTVGDRGTALLPLLAGAPDKLIFKKWIQDSSE